jgi:hypothetical protein
MMRPPFSWPCNQEPLPWLGDQLGGSVIPLHVHGHNRLAHDETSYPPTNSLSFLFICGSDFLVENSFSTFSRIHGQIISKV